jgi:hypothetical protein
MNGTWPVSFLDTVVNVRAIYVTAILFLYMFRLEVPIDPQSTVTVMTVVHSLSFIVLAADNTVLMKEKPTKCIFQSRPHI